MFVGAHTLSHLTVLGLGLTLTLNLNLALITLGSYCNSLSLLGAIVYDYEPHVCLSFI